MNEVPGMNIVNKFADLLGMPVVNLNMYRMTFVSVCLCFRKLLFCEIITSEMLNK